MSFYLKKQHKETFWTTGILFVFFGISISIFFPYVLTYVSFLITLYPEQVKINNTLAVNSVGCLHSKSTMASASWPRPFTYPQKSSEKSRQLLRQKQTKDTPDTLFADQDHSVLTNLLFYSEHSLLWHTAFCQHFPFTKKRGICKGRQILVFEDTENNNETRFLTLNLYQNGTVMIQGSESALQVFIEKFEEIKTLALSDNDEDDDPTQVNNKDPNTDTSPGKSDQKIATTTKTRTSVSRMKDSFSLLEVEVVEIK